MVVYRKVASTSMFYYLGNRNFAVLWKAVDYTAVHCVNCNSADETHQSLPDGG
jgi:hypothetical protein